MSRRRPRFTVRRLMVAVAVLAVLLGVGRTFFLAVFYARMSYGHLSKKFTAKSRIEADYHGNLQEKYREAAARPWLHVPPDPPEPE